METRPVENRKAFPLSELPASYRLISGTGRSAIQRIRTYRPLVEILDRQEFAEGVRQELGRLEGVLKVR